MHGQTRCNVVNTTVEIRRFDNECKPFPVGVEYSRLANGVNLETTIVTNSGRKIFEKKLPSRDTARDTDTIFSSYISITAIYI